MSKYRNTRTGGVRDFAAPVGFPWVPAEEEAKGLSSMRKADLVDMATGLGLETDGKTADELRSAISEAQG